MLQVEALKQGDVVGRYRIVRELGRGAMGMVFLAEDTMLQQQVCLKMLHPSLVNHTEASARFTREIVLARRIAHHGVCRVYDLHNEGGLRFLSMEFVDGTPLRELVGKDAKPVAIEQALRITRNICRALAAAHDVGVIHRDLKPRNVMLRSPQTATEPDDICLLDFGIATAEDAVSQALTSPGVTLGTRHYIAPEVWMGEQATPRSDLFAVGVILFNLLVARMPWPAAPGGGEFLDRMHRAPAPRPSSLRPEVPNEVDVLLARALAVDPAKRFAGAAAFAKACDVTLQRLFGVHADPTTAPSMPPLMPAQPRSTAAAAAIANRREATHDEVTRIAPPPVFFGEDAKRNRSPSTSAAPPAAIVHGNHGFDEKTQEAAAPPPAQSVPTRSDEARPAGAAGPHIDDVGDDSASWVVGGRAVALPVRPKKAPSSSDSETAIVHRVIPAHAPAPVGRPVWKKALAAAALLGVVVTAVFMVVVSDDVDGPMPTDPTHPTPTDPTHPTHPTPTDPTHPTPTHPTPTDPTPTDPTPTDPTPTDPTLPTPTDPTPTDPTPTDPTPAPAPDPTPAPAPAPAPTSTPRTNGGKAEAVQAQRDLRGAMASRGLIDGDDELLDRLSGSCARLIRSRRYDGAVDAANSGIARVAEVQVDRDLVSAKLTRFNARFDKVKSAKLRDRLDELAGQASLDFAAGRYDAANGALNTAFALLSKDR